MDPTCFERKLEWTLMCMNFHCGQLSDRYRYFLMFWPKAVNVVDCSVQSAL
jgi:hypothetical protein